MQDNKKVTTDAKGQISIKIKNQNDRRDIHELFTAMGDYLHAIESFNKLVLNAYYPNSDYKLELSGVENGSIISKVKSNVKNMCKKFIEKVDIVATDEISRLTYSNEHSVKVPEDVNNLAKILEKNIAEKLGNDNERSPYIDPVELAKILKLISDGNENLYEEENVEIGRGNNVIPINTKFRSQVPASKMFAEKKSTYKGYDIVKVVRPCNFGNSKWDLRSIVTGDNYSANFDDNCDWLARYQNGEFPTVTAKHTLKILVSYDKFTSGKNYQIKNAIIKNVEILEESITEQINIFSNLNENTTFQDEELFHLDE